MGFPSVGLRSSPPLHPLLVFILITDSIADNSNSLSVNNGTNPFLYSDTTFLPNLLAIPENLTEISASTICLHNDERFVDFVYHFILF